MLLVRTRRTKSVARAAEGISSDGALVLDARIPLREALALAWGGPIGPTFGYELAAEQLRALEIERTS